MINSFKLIFFYLIFQSVYSYSCSCNTTSFVDKYIHSDLVASITIIKNYPNEDNSYYYKSDVTVNKLYKGECIKSLYIYGGNGRSYSTSCDIFYKEGTTLLIYARIIDGVAKIDMCSECFETNTDKLGVYMSIKYKNEIKLLHSIIDSDINYTHHNSYYIKTDKSFIKISNLKKIDNDVFFVEVFFNKMMKVKRVKITPNIRCDVKRRIKKYFKNSEWSRMGEQKGKKSRKYFLVAHIRSLKGGENMIFFDKD